MKAQPVGRGRTPLLGIGWGSGMLALFLLSWGLAFGSRFLVPGGLAGQDALVVSVYWGTALFAVLALAYSFSRTSGAERVFWGLLCGGMAARLLGHLNGLLTVYVEQAGVEGLGGILGRPWSVGVTYLSFGCSYAMLFAAMILLVSSKVRRVSPVLILDSLGVMLAVGITIWCFLPGVSGLSGPPGFGGGAAVVLFRPVLDSGLVYLGFIVLAARSWPPFAGYLAAAFAAFLAADGAYLWSSAAGSLEPVAWAALIGTLGFFLLGLGALKQACCPAGLMPELGFRSGVLVFFWLGPFSPLLHYGMVLAWAASHPPVPPYVLVGGAALMMVLALKVALEARVGELLRLDQGELTRRLEGQRISAELHDTVKPYVNGVFLLLGACAEYRRRGDNDKFQECLNKAAELSGEADLAFSRLITGLRTFFWDANSDLASLVGRMVRDFGRYSGARIHNRLSGETLTDGAGSPLENLSPRQLEAAHRVVGEALWNAIRHSGAGNIWIEVENGPEGVRLSVRDDGAGFREEGVSRGVGLFSMRERAEATGGQLDVVSEIGSGTVVRLAYGKRRARGLRRSAA